MLINLNRISTVKTLYDTFKPTEIGTHTRKTYTESQSENLGFLHYILQSVSACQRFHVSFTKTLRYTHSVSVNLEEDRDEYIQTGTVLSGSNIERLRQHISKISREMSKLVCIHVDNGTVQKLLNHLKNMGQKFWVLVYSQKKQENDRTSKTG